MKLAVKIVDWTQSISVNGRKFDKRCAAAEVAGLWYVGTGVLIEQDGLDDIFVPLGNVLCIRADGKLTSEDWSGGSVPSSLNMATVAPRPVKSFNPEHSYAPGPAQPDLTGPLVDAANRMAKPTATPVVIEPERTPAEKPAKKLFKPKPK